MAFCSFEDCFDCLECKPRSNPNQPEDQFGNYLCELRIPGFTVLGR